MRKTIMLVALFGIAGFTSLLNADTINLVQNFGTTPTVGVDNVVSVSPEAVGGISWYAHFSAAQDGNGLYFAASGTSSSIGVDVVYGFDAGEGQEFVGVFNVDMMMYAGIYDSSWGSVTISYSFDNTNWTELQQVSTQNGTDWNGNIGYAVEYSGLQSFSADGETEVYIKSRVYRRWYVQNAQLARLEFSGTTQEIPEPATIALLAAGSFIYAVHKKR